MRNSERGNRTWQVPPPCCAALDSRVCGIGKLKLQLGKWHGHFVPRFTFPRFTFLFPRSEFRIPRFFPLPVSGFRVPGSAFL
jgi:hypothetical protein